MYNKQTEGRHTLVFCWNPFSERLMDRNNYNGVDSWDGGKE